jgi:hypothetical protein
MPAVYRSFPAYTGGDAGPRPLPLDRCRRLHARPAAAGARLLGRRGDDGVGPGARAPRGLLDVRVLPEPRGTAAGLLLGRRSRRPARGVEARVDRYAPRAGGLQRRLAVHARPRRAGLRRPGRRRRAAARLDQPRRAGERAEPPPRERPGRHPGLTGVPRGPRRCVRDPPRLAQRADARDRPGAPLHARRVLPLPPGRTRLEAGARGARGPGLDRPRADARLRALRRQRPGRAALPAPSAATAAGATTRSRGFRTCSPLPSSTAWSRRAASSSSTSTSAPRRTRPRSAWPPA